MDTIGPVTIAATGQYTRLPAQVGELTGDKVEGFYTVSTVGVGTVATLNALEPGQIAMNTRIIL